jgi:hypothetical protein
LVEDENKRKFSKIFLFGDGCREQNGRMREQLGLEWWQSLGIYFGPPLIIAIFVIWRAVYKATTHPDQKLLKKGRR